MARRTSKQIQSDKDYEILSRISKRIVSWYDYFSENNDNYVADSNFLYDSDGQWTDDEIREYDIQEKKPRRTFNMLIKHINQLCGEYAENTYNVKVRAADNKSTSQDKVDIVSGLLRSIAFSSSSSKVYNYAMKCALSGGYGAYRVNVVRENEHSFNMIPRYEIIYDPTMCFWDSNARENTDKSDGLFCGICTSLSRDEFENKYPHANVDISSNPFGINYTDGFSWSSKDSITIVDYYEKEFYDKIIVQLSDGSVLDKEEAEETLIKEKRARRILKKINQFDMIAEPPLTIVKEESIQTYRVRCYRCTGSEILERWDWDGKKMPIIFQPGVSVFLEGKEHTLSFIRFAKDAQRTYNFARSEYLYRLKLTRYEPFIGTPKNISGFEEMWQDVTKAKSILLCNPDPVTGLPSRQTTQEVPSSLIAEMHTSAEDIKNILGRYDSNLGAPGNETSGVAIFNRQSAGNFSAKPFFDNAKESVEGGILVVLDMLKNIYDTERSVTIVDDTDSEIDRMINTSDEDDITKGIYSLRITAGSSFAIQKQDELRQLMSLVQVWPQLLDVTGDLAIDNIDLKNSAQLAKRVRTYVMPQITVDETNDEDAQKQLQRQNQASAAQAQIALIEKQAQVKQMEASAYYDQLSGVSKIMDSQTKQSESGAKLSVEQQRIEAEKEKTSAETLQEILKMIQTNDKAVQVNQSLMPGLIQNQ